MFERRRHPGLFFFRGSVAWLLLKKPMRTPVNASPVSSRMPAHELGVDVGRYSFTVVDSHHLLLAGLPAHSNKEIGMKEK